MDFKPKSPFLENPAADIDEDMRFDDSLKELKQLRSQLHYAADYCETTFSRSHDKKDVMDYTKEYIRRAVVTVVDHLGSVSANLNCLISENNTFTEAELRINCLKQRLLSCEQYAHKLALANMRWSEKIPRFHSRYLSLAPTFERLKNEDLRGQEETPPLKEDFPLLLCKFNYNPIVVENSTSKYATTKGDSKLALAVPVGHGLPLLSEGPIPTFHFQGTQRVRRSRKSLHGSDILALIRRTTRT